MTVPLQTIPHTETGVEGDRDLTVTFIQDVQVTIQNESKEWIFSDRPDFSFADEAGLSSFHWYHRSRF